MSSKVLKSLSDCYNFTDETNDGKNKGKRRQRLRTASLTTKSVLNSKPNDESKSCAKDGQKRDLKWRCDSYREVLRSAVWFNNIRADSQSTIDSVLELLSKHMSDDCNCVNICWTHLLIGNTYFERFLCNRKEFENHVINEELTHSVTKSTSESDNSPANDIPVSKESKLDSNVMPGLVDLNHMTDLLEPLEQAIDHWSTALDLNIKLKVMTDEALIRFHIYNNISSVVQIFAFYDRIESRLKSSKLMNKFCKTFSTKESEISLTANYYLVKTFISLGDINKSTHSLTRLSTSTSGTTQMPETYGKSLNFLAKCELDLMNGRTERAAKALKCFLESDYLKKLTINRYYIKGLALVLASKFASKHFKYSDNFQEFLEPLQMSICILKRWNPWLSSVAKPNNENQMVNSEDLDPIWYKYSVLAFAFESMQLSSEFYKSIQMPIDSFFFFNALMKLCRRHCAAVRLSKLLIIGSQLDVICDHKYSSHIKLSNALLCLESNRWSSDSNSVFNSFSSVSTISPDTRRAIHGPRPPRSPRRPRSPRPSRVDSDSDLEIIEIKSTQRQTDFEAFESEECEHNNQFTSVWQLKQRLRKLEEKSAIDSEVFGDTIEGHFGRGMTLTDENTSKGILELFLIRIEIEFRKILFADPMHSLSEINDIYRNCLQTYGSNILKLNIAQLLGDNDSQTLGQNFYYYKSLNLKFIETIAKLQLEGREFEECIKTCHQIQDSKSFSYSERLIHSNLLYFEAFSKLVLYKNRNDLKTDKLWIEYNTNVMEDIPFERETAGPSLTPPKHKNKIKTVIPKAPKQKGLKNEEMNDYLNALSSKVLEEMERNPLKSTNGKNKLNFENDSKMRSLSVSESNNGSNDKIIDSDVISGEMLSNTKTIVTTKRNTRSRTASKTLKSTGSSGDENRTKRSNTKKSNAMTSSKSKIHLSEDIDELNEVFYEKLVIKEEMKTNSDNQDLDSILLLLNKIFDLMSSHPSSKLYASIHELLAEIYSLDEKSNAERVGFHFSQTLGSSYRYRNLFIAERKRKLNRSSKYNLNCIQFKDQSLDKYNENALKSLTDGLPSDWRIIQISAVDNGSQIPDLQVCRYQRDKTPVLLKIKTDPEKIIKHFMTQFAEIIERSNASIVNKDRETFWRLRYTLDGELMVLLRSVEETWFGPFKGILLGELQSKGFKNLCETLKSYIMDWANFEDLICLSEPLLEVMVESLPSLKYIEYRAAMFTLFKGPSKPSDALISQCFAKYEELFCDCFPIDNKELIFTTYGISPVGLILDKSLESFPFESLPTIQSYNQSIFRTPSLLILSLMYNTFKDEIYSKGIEESDVYYVVNPADNLPKTEEFFKEAFTSMKEWKGVIGKPPQPLDLKEALNTKEAYIFFGHGAGASYYRTLPEGLDGCNINCASIVMGCSSGKLFSEGKQLESYGTPYRFMMNGSPCYVGVLWDVTDKDIDKFSDQLLSYWFSNWKPDSKDRKEVMPITKSVSLSRKSCRLQHLIGAAPVVYGLPLFTKSRTK